jgi:hypothetical protein
MAMPARRRGQTQKPDFANLLSDENNPDFPAE